MSLTLKEYITGVKNGSIDANKTLLSYLDKAKTQDTYNAFVRIHDDYVNAHENDFVSLPLA